MIFWGCPRPFALLRAGVGLSRGPLTLPCCAPLPLVAPFPSLSSTAVSADSPASSALAVGPRRSQKGPTPPASYRNPPPGPAPSLRPAAHTLALRYGPRPPPTAPPLLLHGPTSFGRRPWSLPILLNASPPHLPPRSLASQPHLQAHPRQRVGSRPSQPPGAGRRFHSLLSLRDAALRSFVASPCCAPHSLRLLRSSRFGHYSAVPPLHPPHRFPGNP